MKRSDVTTLEVLTAVRDLGQLAGYFHLCEKYPSKIVDAAFEREVRNGRMDYGVTLRSGWVEPAGHKWLAGHTLTAGTNGVVED